MVCVFGHIAVLVWPGKAEDVADMLKVTHEFAKELDMVRNETEIGYSFL